jgi:hypothetical protein
VTEGDEWQVERSPMGSGPYLAFDDHVPTAIWFWRSLQWHCVPECCGLDAYEFTVEAVRWALYGGPDPESATVVWCDPHPLLATQLASDLDALALKLSNDGSSAASAALFNDILTTRSYATLFSWLANAVRHCVPQ